jgi:hypothetical protein
MSLIIYVARFVNTGCFFIRHWILKHYYIQFLHQTADTHNSLNFIIVNCKKINGESNLLNIQRFDLQHVSAPLATLTS